MSEDLLILAKRCSKIRDIVYIYICMYKLFNLFLVTLITKRSIYREQYGKFNET